MCAMARCRCQSCGQALYIVTVHKLSHKLHNTLTPKQCASCIRATVQAEHCCLPAVGGWTAYLELRLCVSIVQLTSVQQLSAGKAVQTSAARGLQRFGGTINMSALV